MTRITFGSVLRYAALPGIIPQLKDLFGSGFAFIPYAIALVFGALKLLPASHPYLRGQNIGRFGITHVILEARRHLVFDRRHADQVILYFTVLLGMLLMVAQILILCFALITQFAHAGVAANFASFFVTQNPTNDVAHILLDRIFGIPNLYNSCVAQGIVCLNGTVADGAFPAPYHIGLHTMLQFYSLGVGVIGIIIFLYYAVVVVVETAQTGMPFGRRFDKLWAPIRMVVAIGLLIPVSYGLNGAQLLTLYMAKWGSAFATNGWTLFVTTLVGSSTNLTITGLPANQMVATPRSPDTQSAIKFFTVAGTCHRLYRDVVGVEIDAWLVRAQGNSGAGANAVRLVDTDWTQALGFYENGDILVVFGHRDATRYPAVTGNVEPYCGQMILRTLDTQQAGSRSIQESYYERFLRRPWRNILTAAPQITPGVANLPAPNNSPQAFFSDAVDRIAEIREGYYAPNASLPDEVAKDAIRSQFRTDANEAIDAAVAAQVANTGPWLAQLNALGWAGAGIWYNRIAELNGAMIDGVSNMPSIQAMPKVMEDVARAKGGNNSDVPATMKYLPYLANGETVQLEGGAEALLLANSLWLADMVWTNDSSPDGTMDGSVERISTKNALRDFVTLVFGLEGLYSMVDNNDIHPLAQLVTLGKQLLQASIRNIAIGVGGNALGIPEFLEKNISLPKEYITMITNAASTFGMMTLSIGFILYYIIPFMPFMYFFFQVGTWVKELFEAMVGLPLWALAHLRIDEGGLPGPSGMNGYFLIFEIFLRPILLVFGLIGSISIFAAQVQILHDVFGLVVSNVGGSNVVDAQAAQNGGNVDMFDQARQHIDTFFFTIMYAIIVYLLATSSFKLIYQVPNNILRWMSAGVTAFSDSEHDTPASLTTTASVTLGTVTNQMSGLSGMFLSKK